MVADTADGADGVVGSVLAHGRYPDGPRSQPPLAAEDDLNPKRAKRGLCPTQPASERAGAAIETQRQGRGLFKLLSRIPRMTD
jgi:hypothetical protein